MSKWLYNRISLFETLLYTKGSIHPLFKVVDVKSAKVQKQKKFKCLLYCLHW